MLLTTLEIVPFGQWDNRYKIKSIYIANVTKEHNPHKGDYDIWVDKDPTETGTIRPKPDVQIKKFKRHLGAQELLRQVLNKLYAKEQKEKKK